jgi:hypothetical protein
MRGEKAMFFLYLIKHYALKTYGWVEVDPPVLALAPEGGESSASGPYRFTPWETVLGTHFIGGWGWGS